ncbi:hypothetical protein COS54_02940 [Candidatus Shapirobacteria bacterium CG03_land_8_20_14_0_80_39_12]|uniref:DNA-directed DNA polymerase n=1 Tax=Candidatus Shapirobacteria bacterium CG03_land_8_20_14_0_80_39_12 TaxID=1974879 RepID=A0A2M7BBQ6_9BACT|nr:MAG: hypothetical protein COS54_02940 [Candidatus Shapirobacteria bacterium CG03_land_8_20_14_0_80_39_12]
MTKIFVFSGEDIISSRKAFLEYLDSFKDKDYEIVRINGKDASEETLMLHSLPNSLFGQKKLLAIDSLLSGKKFQENEKILKALSYLECDIVIWENKNFSKADQLKYPNFVFKNFKLPQVLFTFLDAITPGKPENNLRLLKDTIESVDSAYLFLMLIRQIRLLILASDKNDLLKLAPWQKSKIQKQAKYFTLEKLKEINKKLLEIDFRQKTSQTPFPLKHQLEFLLTEI